MTTPETDSSDVPAPTSDAPQPFREPSPPVRERSPSGSSGSAGGGSPKPLSEEQRRDLEEQFVHPVIDTSFITPTVERRLRGPELVGFVEGMVKRSEGLVSDAQALRVHLEQPDVAVQASFISFDLHLKLEAALEQARKEAGQ